MRLLAFAVTIVVFNFMTGLTPARADITRSCNAYFEGNTFHGTTKVNPFTSKGHCGNLFPNRCRERARKTAHICMDAHWKSKGAPPQKCRVGGIMGYDMQDFTNVLGSKVCCGIPWAKVDISNSKIEMTLYRVTTGDTNCPHRMKLYSGTFDCTNFLRYCE